MRPIWNANANLNLQCEWARRGGITNGLATPEQKRQNGFCTQLPVMSQAKSLLFNVAGKLELL